jgi:hypothetical protein
MNLPVFSGRRPLPFLKKAAFPELKSYSIYVGLGSSRPSSAARASKHHAKYHPAYTISRVHHPARSRWPACSVCGFGGSRRIGVCGHHGH